MDGATYFSVFINLHYGDLGVGTHMYIYEELWEGTLIFKQLLRVFTEILTNLYPLSHLRFLSCNFNDIWSLVLEMFILFLKISQGVLPIMVPPINVWYMEISLVQRVFRVLVLKVNFIIKVHFYPLPSFCVSAYYL